MRARRFTVVIADRSNGRIRRIGVNLRPMLVVGWGAAVLALVAMPILMGLGAKWSARGEIDELRTANLLLRDENNNYRAATGELTGQIQSLESVIEDLGARSLLDPAQAKAMARLPAMVKSRATGGAVQPSALSELAKAPWISPEDTFGALRDLLQGLENRLTYVRRD